MKMSQFREGSLGRFVSHEAGIPVYFNAAWIPPLGAAAVDDVADEGVGFSPCVLMKTSRSFSACDLHNIHVYFWNFLVIIPTY